ncbi:MAG: SBBP repeat-containing protein [Ignavibacteria bacterium]|nr:SBBP repeat-containing protein [Ignavibacteria bacterium]MBK9404548.1 SBBP repeat-containing protein [Ignavibacteria bacterium]
MKNLFNIFAGILIFSGTLSAQCLNVYNCWLNKYGGTGNNKDSFYGVQVSKTSGNVFVTGETYNSGGANADYITVKYSPAGDTLWARVYNGTGNGNDVAHSIAIDDSDNVYVTGESKGVSPNGVDYVTIKYNSSGVEKWVNRYNGPSGNGDFAYSVFVDAFRNVYVTGSAHFGGGNQMDFLTIKYNSNGAVLWTRNYDFGSSDFANKVIVDNAKNVYVIGYSISTANTGHDYRTIKYDSSGNLKWTKMFNYLSSSTDEPSDIAVDNSGNVYVTGTSRTTVSFYSTIKYNSSGDSVWYKYYVNIGEGNQANAILLDTVGNVYVTGTSGGYQSNDDFATVKYNSVTGQEMWSKRYNGTGNGSDRATSLVQGKNGKIFVGGGSFGNGTGDDFVIVEYDINTGDTCFVSRFSLAGGESINAMSINFDKGYIYACGQTTAGTGFYDALTSRYCLLGVVNSVYKIYASIEGYYNPALNSMNMKDTVRAYLRKISSPFEVVDSAIAVLDSATLLMTCVFNNSASGNYYIVLKQRNTIETWSKSGGETFVCGTEMNYDYTNSVTKAFGNNMKLVDTSPVRFAIYSGDVNQEGTIDASDLSETDNDAFSSVSGYVRTDVTGDYFVDAADVSIVDNNAFSSVSAVTP